MPSGETAEVENVVTESPKSEDKVDTISPASEPVPDIQAEGDGKAQVNEDVKEVGDSKQKVKLKELAAQAKAKGTESAESLSEKIEDSNKNAPADDSEITKTTEVVDDTDTKTDTKTVPAQETVDEAVTTVEDEKIKTASSTEEVGELTAEQVKADLIKKQALMLQEDTTDSEVCIIKVQKNEKYIF